ncbi:hypothetical protein GGQ87_002965 [Brevundimonas alba]|uniref:Uncharacterized protein n=1 Tax=Brevundimonas alba TaxID=74314 RepID=A0A7X5YQ57_9CAUL|nr:hypothetical protein [Brevundimonas alba]NJC42670.1 hypothetical protein [Brevundimonas alba]
MTQSHSPLDAFDEAPRVTACDGEVVISGSLVNAAYTLSAGRALLASLSEALEEAERQLAPANGAGNGLGKEKRPALRPGVV